MPMEFKPKDCRHLRLKQIDSSVVVDNLVLTEMYCADCGVLAGLAKKCPKEHCSKMLVTFVPNRGPFDYVPTPESDRNN